jgi:hypothetical protein
VNVLKPNQRATVYTLLERNTPSREIARITGIDRKTLRSYCTRWLAEISNSPGLATGSDPLPNTDAGPVATQIPPPWPPAPTSISTSLCEVHREFIEAQLRLRRDATAISGLGRLARLHRRLQLRQTLCRQAAPQRARAV